MVNLKVTFTEGQEPQLRDVVRHLVGMLELADLAERLASANDHKALGEVNAWCSTRIAARRRQGVVFPPTIDEQDASAQVVDLVLVGSAVTVFLRWDALSGSRVADTLDGLLLRARGRVSHVMTIGGEAVDVLQSERIGMYASEVAADLPHNLVTELT
ncbi:MAG TPA: hypothetical protein VGZ32_10850 [Actinocrinis sp.]|jgi:hypothetical protein|uniref:hypothetical protein n=1 Tax=Actinocrinis sp. TaxID=1920516 RepID=UPI002DDD4105|nr:hypothetical protein [Actinocrinis sp.]HEV3170831.1 hypothetical protein [Actinocrinis sp.]